jgi:RHS repeat-associated protein
MARFADRLVNYDTRSRLTQSTVWNGGLSYPLSYQYDQYGNLNPNGPNPINPGNNRLINGAYDDRGNLTAYGSQRYDYDGLSRQTRSGGERYLYDGSGERIARVTGGERYHTITPCRLLDTRPSNSLAHGETRVVSVTGGSCGVAAGATSVTGNLTVVAPGHGGFLRLSPSGTSPSTSTLNFSAGQIRANNFTLGLSAEGALDLLAFSGTGTGLTDAIIDLSGYFMTSPSSESWALTFREEGNRISSEYLGAVRQKDYFYLGNLLVATRTGTGSGTWLYYASDHLGSPRLVTSASKAKVEDHSYDAFGIEMTGGFGNQPLKFAAMERDGASKNDYVHARFQSSELGRFLSPDLLGGRPDDPQTWNRYAYALNNPLRFIDPDGRAVTDALDWWSYQQSSRAWSEAFSSFLTNPSVGTGLTAAVKFVEASADAVGVLVPGVPAVAGHMTRLASWGGNAADLVRLEKSLASESQVAQALSGGGRVIAGAGSRAVFRDVDRIVKTYGGEAGDWVKKSSSKYVARDGSVFEIHWVENLRTGKKVELKTNLLHVIKKAPPGEPR